MPSPARIWGERDWDHPTTATIPQSTHSRAIEVHLIQTSLPEAVERDEPARLPCIGMKLNSSRGLAQRRGEIFALRKNRRVLPNQDNRTVQDCNAVWVLTVDRGITKS